MNLKALRKAMPEADVAPGGKILERIKARVTGSAESVVVHTRGHRFTVDGSWQDPEALASYINSRLPMATIRPR